MQIKFYGSQIGSPSVQDPSYTGSPAALLRLDIFAALKLYLFLPYIVWPLSPWNSGSMCELYPSAANLWCSFLHVILVLMQVPFILSIPLWVLFPVWGVLLGVTVFAAINRAICYVLNGTEMRLSSNPKYASKKGNEHEQWIFLNGVAVGKHWLQSNIDRLALTFGRPVIGVHNKTNGIIFDVIQCLIQRNFNYATMDIRDGYQVIKETLYDTNLTKIVFILHSQGGIEGGMIIDWLLQEVPQDLLAKLEVYTFGCAANHFNNPHLHLISQHASHTHPNTPSMTKTSTSVHFHEPLPAVNGDDQVISTKHSKQESCGGKTIRYIEHYAHSQDFVAKWGVLHYTTNFALSPFSPRYMGRVFERPGMGHQFNQHYLDSMFPLKPVPEVSIPKTPSAPNPASPFHPHEEFKGGIGNSGFLGADEENNEFMSSILESGAQSDAKKDERETWEVSYLGAHGAPLDDGEEEVLLRDMSPASTFTLGKGAEILNGKMGMKDGGFRVGDLSRLWLYVNGKSPKTDEVDVGIARMSTI